MTDQVTFEDLGLSEDILQGLAKKGFKIPTPIQEQTIPLLMNGEKDIIGQAQTGTGKTAAFGLPIIEGITPGLRKVQAIVVAPTRELASQVAVELESLKADRDIRILPVYGGQGMDIQLRQLKQGVDIVVATPGRAIDHLKRKTLRLDDIQFVVLDEADEMLNMGFIEDIEEILSHCPEERRMLLFSATMPQRIKKLAEKFMGDYDIVKVKTETESADTVEQVYYSVYERDKLRALRRLIDTEPEFYALVFSRTRVGADRLAEKLNSAGLDVEALHGEVSQAQRERILAKFKRGHASILVATDVAARGIDINNLSHVINFDLPDNPESYVHRIGRTGRAGKQGKAISFVAPKDRHKIRQIMQITKAPIEKLTLPHGQMVVDQKKQAMIERVVLTSEDDIPQEYHNIAKDLLASSKPQEMMAALLMMHFGGKLNPDSYPELQDPDAGRSVSRPTSSRGSMGGDRERSGRGRDRDRRGGGFRSGRGERSFDRNEERGGEERREGNSQTRRAERRSAIRRDDDRNVKVPFKKVEEKTEQVASTEKRKFGREKPENTGGSEKRKFGRPEKEKKKFTKKFEKKDKFEKKEKFEGVGKADKPKKKFKKKKIKAFG
ncbi:MAG: DEAD/DEAH box helicase [Saprospiraceae bacterium]